MDALLPFMEAGFNVLAAEPYVLVSKYTALRGYCQSIYFHESCYNISRKLRLFFFVGQS